MIRTKSCKACGEVVFSMNSSYEHIELICESCKTTNLISLGKYIALKNICESCVNDLFKIKIDDKGNEERIDIECTKCKATPNTYFIDQNGIEIDRVAREMLIIQDNIKDVNNRLNRMENKIENLETDLRNTKENMIENLSQKINENIIDINTVNYEVNNYSDELNRLKDTLENIERSVVSNLYLFK